VTNLLLQQVFWLAVFPAVVQNAIGRRQRARPSRPSWAVAAMGA